ncbi:hypothetical protein JXA56_00050 [Candidatus Micrarchaeota archaeon]|nr:hypothetical protein [Candidatus Micrarchaeota archaeon]
MRGVFVVLAVMLLLGCTSVSEEAEKPAPVVQPPPEEVPLCSGPVCGSDGITYETDCDALDAAVQSFVLGECLKEEECIETDGGMYSGVFGSVTKGNISYHDFCENSSILIEYACIENEIKNSSIECPGMCVDGECIELKPELDKTCRGPSQPDIYVRETVTVAGVNYTDVCIDFITVKDYYCKDNNVTAVNRNCEPGERCDGGKCVLLEFRCSETDEGRDVYTKGKTTQNFGISTTFSEWDDCDDEGTVIEHYCSENNTAVTEYIRCESGYKCLLGRCVKSKCSETDSGFDIYKKGTVQIGDDKYTDDCLNDYTLREYFCYGDRVEEEDLRCPEGYICDNDRCVEGYIRN